MYHNPGSPPNHDVHLLHDSLTVTVVSNYSKERAWDYIIYSKKTNGLTS